MAACDSTDSMIALIMTFFLLVAYDFPIGLIAVKSAGKVCHTIKIGCITKRPSLMADLRIYSTIVSHGA